MNVASKKARAAKGRRIIYLYISRTLARAADTRRGGSPGKRPATQATRYRCASTLDTVSAIYHRSPLHGQRAVDKACGWLNDGSSRKFLARPPARAGFREIGLRRAWRSGTGSGRRVICDFAGPFCIPLRQEAEYADGFDKNGRPRLTHRCGRDCIARAYTTMESVHRLCI